MNAVRLVALSSTYKFLNLALAPSDVDLSLTKFKSWLFRTCNGAIHIHDCILAFGEKFVNFKVFNDLTAMNERSNCGFTALKKKLQMR